MAVIFTVVCPLPVSCDLNLESHLHIKEILVLAEVQRNFLLGGFQLNLQGLNPSLLGKQSCGMIALLRWFCVCIHEGEHASSGVNQDNMTARLPAGPPVPSCTFAVSL